MRGQWTQLIVLLLAIGAPALSWVFGKLREQAELKKARDTARRRHEDSLRTTQLAERASGGISPESRKERERQDLAARRQAQLRELRQRQYERATKPETVVVRGPGAPGSVRPPQAPQRPTPRTPGPLRPGVPTPPTGRRTPPVAVPPRPAPGRPRPPIARPIPTAPPRRPMVAPPAPVRPRVEERRRESERGQIAATEIGQGRAAEALRRPTGVGADVRGMLMSPEGGPRPRAELAKAIALTEVLAPPMSLRTEDQFSWNRV